MSEAARTAAFGTALRAAFDRFKREEAIIRAQETSAVEAGTAPLGLTLEAMLERPTRRFLIDPMLRQLGWDPDNPHQVTEEARSWSEDGDRLYFDYLGVNRERAPTLLVEAKGADAKAARPPRAADVTGARMAVLISEALAVLKAGSTPSAVLVEWADWLDDLRTYVQSLGEVRRKTLRRVVITSGRWLIIFTNPITAFIDDGPPALEAIHCYVSMEEIVDRHAEIYWLLARRRLINTLPLTLTLGEALEILEPAALTASYRGLVVATRLSGAGRGEYPTRTVYPAVVLLMGGVIFAVVTYNAEPLEEPRDGARLAGFLASLAARGDTFEQSVMARFGRLDLAASPLSHFPLDVREPEQAEVFAPAPKSTAAMAAAIAPARPQFVRRTGERDVQHEYLVITGQAWSYKTEEPFGEPCNFHSFPSARGEGVAAEAGHFDRVADAFTVSGDPQHCEHDPLKGLRAGRCQIALIEAQLCCRVCVFHSVCWPDADLPRLPCAT